MSVSQPFRRDTGVEGITRVVPATSGEPTEGRTAGVVGLQTHVQKDDGGVVAEWWGLQIW